MVDPIFVEPEYDLRWLEVDDSDLLFEPTCKLSRMAEQGRQGKQLTKVMSEMLPEVFEDLYHDRKRI